jgi:hypothetical protein
MASLSTLGFFNDLGSAMPQFSPHYADVAPHGGFNQGHGNDGVAFLG